jgi:hypothetical protein
LIGEERVHRLGGHLHRHRIQLAPGGDAGQARPNLGGLALVITERAFRDQVVQFSQADIAAIQNGYDSEGVPEAREVVQQSMAGPGVPDFFLLQKDGKFVAGNLPMMPPRTGVFSLNRDGHEILGVGKMLAPGVYAWSGSDLARVQIARREIVQTMIWLFAAALLLAVIGGIGLTVGLVAVATGSSSSPS